MSAPEEVGVEGQHDAVHAVPDEHAPIAPYAFKHRETTAFPPTRIKKIMLSDNEVGKIKKESPALLALCVEMFIEQLMHAAAEATVADGARLLSAGHLKRAVMNNPKWDFIQQLLSKVADLPEHAEGETPKKPRKKREPKKDDDEEAKPVVKRAGGGAKRGKKAKEENAEMMEADVVAEIPMETEKEHVEDAAPVFVPVSLAPSVNVGPSMALPVDEDDFDA